MKKVLIVIPAYNEEEILEKNITALHSYLTKNLKGYNWKILISDNASIDKTPIIAEKLSKNFNRISCIHMKDRPKSKSLKAAWLSEEADIYACMDADLSTDITHIPELLSAIDKCYDLAIGSRVSEKSNATRSIFREIMSRSLIFMIQKIHSAKIKDFQCGFKAINSKVRNQVIPKMKCLNVGFMDTEMIVVSINKKFKIKEIPVIWKDERKSKGPIFKGIIDALWNTLKIKKDILTGYYNEKK